MSTSERQVVVQTDNPQAELLLIDSDFRVVARGTSPLRASIAIGLYAAKAKVGDEESELLFRLAEGTQEMSVTVAAPHFESPIPLAMTSTTHEYHTAAAQRFLTPGNATLNLGGDSEIMICIRDPWRYNFRVDGDAERDAYQRSFSGFRLLDIERSVVLDLDRSAELNVADGYAAVTVGLPAGAYLLAYERGAQAFRLSLPTVSGWTLQCYINLVADGRGAALVPDLLDAAMLYGRMDEGFDPWREDLVATETIRKGMLDGRTHVDTPSMRKMLGDELRSPMLGLYAAHLLLAGDPPDYQLIRALLGKLQDLLGQSHPDVIALACELHRRQSTAANPTRPADLAGELQLLNGPPLLARSWDLLLAAAAVPSAASEQHPVFRVANHSIGRGIYLNWLEHAGAASPAPPSAPPTPPDLFDITLQDRLTNTTLGGALLTNLTAGLLKTTGHAVSTALGWARKLRLGSGQAAPPELARIDTHEDAARALTALARGYDWKKIIPAIRRSSEWIKHFGGLQGELILMLRDIDEDDTAIAAIDAAFVQRLLESQRVPLATLAEAIATIELGGWVASGRFKSDLKHAGRELLQERIR